MKGQPNWESVKALYPVDDLVMGRVVHKAFFGMFLELPDGVIGLIRAPEITRNKSLGPEEFPMVGSQVAAKVIGYIDENHQLVLTMHYE